MTYNGSYTIKPIKTKPNQTKYLNCVLTINWIIWNRTVFKFDSELKNCIMLNWIASNINVYLYKMDFALNIP